MSDSPYRNRIVDNGTEDPALLLDNPANWRVHPKAQQRALQGALEDIGWIQQVIVNRRTGLLIDGHLRVHLAKKKGEPSIPVVYVDLDGNEEAKALATLDPIAGMADTDKDKLKDLISTIETSDERMQDLLSEIATTNKLNTDPTGEKAEAQKSLAERFIIPPFTIIDGRTGHWAERKRAWMTIGIASQEGRQECLTWDSNSGKDPGFYQQKTKVEKRIGRSLTTEEFNRDFYEPPGTHVSSGTSIFDPVLCELCYRWFAPPGGTILDPFAGGSVRGIVAAFLGRKYIGVDLRPEQVEANRRQWDAIGLPHDHRPEWVAADSRTIDAMDLEPVDFVFSCPPYADLEVYSDDPADLSTLAYSDFVDAYREIIRKAVDRLKPNRFAAFVVGDVRDRKGYYYNFLGDTVRAFEDAGARYYNEAIFATPLGGVPIKTGRQFDAGRKLGKVHQNIFVFCKGDPEEATETAGGCAVEAGPLDADFYATRKLAPSHDKILVFCKGDPFEATDTVGTIQRGNADQILAEAAMEEIENRRKKP